jgi:hypothetical protein
MKSRAFPLVLVPIIASGCGSAGEGRLSSTNDRAHARVGAEGGTTDLFRFAIVGDTRPAVEDDTAGYPTDVISQIWQDVAAEQPTPTFAIMTGDYMYAETSGEEVNPQLDLYLSARAAFPNVAYPAMGNHECASFTFTNCGPGTLLGETANYRGFIDRLLSPIQKTTPYYTIHIDAEDGVWTSKFVFVAPNAWNDDQAAWLDAELSTPTTYTFIVRHESRSIWYAPGTSASNDIIDRYPYTLLLEGHTHTFSYSPDTREVITGIGGAPLAGSINYGYVVAERRNDGAIQFIAKDYLSKQVFQTFAVNPDGSPAQ